MGAEAVVFLRPGLAPGFPFLRKQGMQLASKMRFMAAQLLALFEGELWRANAVARQRDGAAARGRRCAAMRRRARHPAGGGERVFAVLAGRRRGGRWRASGRSTSGTSTTGEVRWMCAWDTRAEDVDAFAAARADGLRAVGAAPAA